MKNLITLKSTFWCKWKRSRSSSRSSYWSSFSRRKIIYLLSKISRANEDLRLEIQSDIFSEIQANNDSFTDSILSLLKVFFHKYPIRTLSLRLNPPIILTYVFVFNNVCNFWRYVSHKNSRQINKQQGQKYHIGNDPKVSFDLDQDSPRSRLSMFISRPLPPKYVPQFLPNRVHRVQNSKKIRLSNSIIHKIICWKKQKYTFNLDRVIDGVVVLSIHKNTSEDSTCGFNCTIQKSNGIYSMQYKSQIYLQETAHQALRICHQISITFSPQETTISHLSEIFLYTVQSMDTASL